MPPGGEEAECTEEAVLTREDADHRREPEGRALSARNAASIAVIMRSEKA